jgi:hypothetical protein
MRVEGWVASPEPASLCSADGRPIPREGARTPVALSEYACRAPHLFWLPWHRPVSTYGVTVRPSNSTGVNGDPATGGGSTGCTCAATLTLTVRCRADSSASITSTTHSGSPVCLSACWTTRGEHHPELDRDRTLKSHCASSA